MSRITILQATHNTPDNHTHTLFPKFLLSDPFCDGFSRHPQAESLQQQPGKYFALDIRQRIPTLQKMLDSLKKAEKLLRKGRLSIPHARYFVTCCSEARRTTLTDSTIGEPIRFAWRNLHKEGSIRLLCATIMPDHVHFLFQLGSRLRLGQVVGKLKSMTRDSLEEHEIKWQDNYHDHRLRADKAAESFSRYIFLNPYRSKLITESETWPWWTCNRNYRPEFMNRLDDPLQPPKEWLHAPESIEKIIENDP